MDKHYFKVTVKFRAESWIFRISCNLVTEITDETIYQIVCQHYKTVVGKSEIGFTKTEMSYYEFIVSTLPKFSTESVDKDSAVSGKALSQYLNAIYG